jgi:hypothetical protein
MAVIYVDSRAGAGGTGASTADPLNAFPATVNASDTVHVASGSVFPTNGTITVNPGLVGATTKILVYGFGPKPEFQSTLLSNVVFNLGHSYIQIDNLVVRGGATGFQTNGSATGVEGLISLNNLVTYDQFRYGCWHNSGATTTLAGPGLVVTYTNCVGYRARLANFHSPGNTADVRYIKCKSYDAGLGWPYYKNIKVITTAGTTSEDLNNVSWAPHVDTFSNATYKKTYATTVTGVTVTSEDGVNSYVLTQAASLGSGLNYLEYIQVAGVLYLNIGTSSWCGAHGFTSHPIRSAIPSTGWTNVSGTLWSSPAIVGEAWSVDPYDGTGTNVRNLNKTTGTQTAPALGEFGQVGATIYVNATGFNPANGTSSIGAYVTVGKWNGITYSDCIATGTRRNDPSLGEGHGFAADDYGTNVSFIRCASFRNEGLAFSSNKGQANNWYACLGFGNLAGGVAAPYGRAHNAVHCTFVGNTGSDFSFKSTFFTNFINNISGIQNILQPYLGMPMGATTKYGNITVNSGKGSIGTPTNNFTEASGPYMWSLGGVSADITGVSLEHPHIDHTERYNGMAQTAYVGNDINGLPFSRLNPSPGCAQWRRKSDVQKSRFLKGAMDHRFVTTGNQGLSVETPYFANLTQFTFEIVFRTTKGSIQTLMGYTDGTVESGISPRGFALQNVNIYGPRLFLSNATNQYCAVLNTEQMMGYATNTLDDNDRGWRHLVIRVDTTQAVGDNRVAAWSQSQKNTARYWEGRVLADYNTAVYPVSEAYLTGTYATAAALQTAFPAASNTNKTALVGASAPYTVYISNGTAWAVANVAATIPQNTAFSFPRIFVGTNAPSLTGLKCQGQIGLVRVWPSALTDAQCVALRKAYMEGKQPDVLPTSELLFQPGSYQANTGTTVTTVTAYNTPKFNPV